MSSTIDFSFRSGNKKALENTSLVNHSFNVCVDTQELYIDVDGNRLSISGIVMDGSTEEQIRAITNPLPKIYISSDTMNILAYDTTNLKWLIIGGNHVGEADLATKALQDGNGNVIADYYYPTATAVAEHTTLESKITALTESIAGITDFNAVIISDEGALPTTGATKTLYFVPNEVTATSPNKTYSLYLWIVTGGTGAYYKVGGTDISLTDYAKTADVQTMIANLKTELETEISALKSTVDTTLVADTTDEDTTT